MQELQVAYKRLPLTPEGKLIKNMFNLASPKRLVIVKYPKSGSTLSLCDQPKILVADSEDGADYFEASNVAKMIDPLVADKFISTRKYGYLPQTIFDIIDELSTANKMEKYWELYNNLRNERDIPVKEKKYHELVEFINTMPFPIVAIDTITSLVKISNSAALHEYNQGVKTPKEDIKRVDEYGGVQYIRRKFDEIKTFIEQNAAPFIQYHGHVGQRKRILKKNDDDVNALDIALDGILSTIFTANSEAVASFYRDKGGCWLDFSKKDETDLGSRPTHISNKKIKIAELLTDDQLAKNVRPKTYWDVIYPEIKFA